MADKARNVRPHGRSSLRNATPGTYAIILQSRCHGNVRIGRNLEIEVEPGYYIYVGSAFGPGGVRARIARHFRTAERFHWHIDYLRGVVDPLEAWYSHATDRLEHRWAQLLDDAADMKAVTGFGCSDCRCRAHLFRTCAVPSFEDFRRLSGVELNRIFRPHGQQPLRSRQVRNEGKVME